ncbi:MAG: ABC transporter permease [Butyrivibrio sp.]|nr:ABC transporter permease [Butyrivibrio sp.]
MLNLIDMNITRLFKTKAFYVTAVLTFASLFLLAFFVGGMDFAQVIDGAAVGLCLSMIGIFAAIYSDEERKSGFLKNLETSKEKKGNVFLAKIPVMALYSLVLMIVSVIAGAIGLLKSPEAFASLNIANALIFFVIQLILITAFGVGFMAIYEMGRGLVAPIVASIMLSNGFHVMIIQALANKLVQMIPALGPVFEKLPPTTFQIVTLSKSINMLGEDCPYIQALLVGIILFVVYAFIGSSVFRKRDTF